jgi:hypothetical protein
MVGMEARAVVEAHLNQRLEEHFKRLHQVLRYIIFHYITCRRYKQMNFDMLCRVQPAHCAR